MPSPSSAVGEPVSAKGVWFPNCTSTALAREITIVSRTVPVLNHDGQSFVLLRISHHVGVDPYPHWISLPLPAKRQEHRPVATIPVRIVHKVALLPHACVRRVEVVQLLLEPLRRRQLETFRSRRSP